MISDLPRDMVEEVFSRLPLTSLREVRFTCKAWNTLSKDRSFTKKYISEAKAAAENKQRKEFQMVMLLEHKVYLISVNILNPSMERTGKLVSLDDDAAADRVEICNIFHCDGLLLCVTKDIMNSGLVVWNPFSEETRWIQPRDSYHRYDSYALGYEKKNKYSLRSHKVLRFVDAYDRSVKRQICEFEIYNLNSDSWKVLDVNLDWEIQGFHRGLSLKGNTYWFAAEKHVGARLGSRLFLLCFDFTTERFGPSLRLPFRGHYLDTVKLSSVREEQLAVLFQEIGAPAYTLKIWISSKIEPNAVSWNELFLDVDMKPLTGFPFLNGAGSFFVDVKKEVVVVIDITTRNMAYIIGKDGYFKQVDLGDFAYGNCWPLVCSYVPSSVKIKQPYVPSSVKIKKPYVPSSEKIKQPYVPSSVKIKQPAPRGNQLDKHFSPVPSTLIIIFLLIFCCSLVYSMFSCTLG